MGTHISSWKTQVYIQSRLTNLLSPRWPRRDERDRCGLVNSTAVTPYMVRGDWMGWVLGTRWPAGRTVEHGRQGPSRRRLTAHLTSSSPAATWRAPPAVVMDGWMVVVYRVRAAGARSWRIWFRRHEWSCCHGSWSWLAWSIHARHRSAALQLAAAWLRRADRIPGLACASVNAWSDSEWSPRKGLCWYDYFLAAKWELIGMNSTRASTGVRARASGQWSAFDA
jgi:hypothetical protein